MNKYILHDLPPHYEDSLGPMWNGNIIPARKPFARCTGCFRCWLKTPGKCTLIDGMELLGKSLLSSDEVVIISEGVYGGFSVSIKRLWDRCIPGVLPFFAKKNNELHHVARYKNHPKFKVIFYNGHEMLPNEKELAEKLVAANALNFMSQEYEVHFLNGVQELEGFTI